MVDEEWYRKDNKKRGKTTNQNLKKYNPIASKPKKLNKTRGGVASDVEISLKYTARHFDAETECTIFEVDFEEKFLNFCVVYRPQSLKQNYFLPDFEDLLQFLRTLEHGTIL